jgi:hypothetical protein
VQVAFFYQNNQHSYKKEIVISALCNAISTFLELPDKIDVCLYPLNNAYGGIDIIHANRIGIDFALTYEELPIVLAHELIHVHQRKTGKLKITPSGKYFWNKVYYTDSLPDKLTFEEYKKLPWEAEAYDTQKEVLSKAIQILSSKHNKQHNE